MSAATHVQRHAPATSRLQGSAFTDRPRLRERLARWWQRLKLGAARRDLRRHSPHTWPCTPDNPSPRCCGGQRLV